ncbi:hypothetical protein L195_g057765, partial [Trifolium pratense]
ATHLNNSAKQRIEKSRGAKPTKTPSTAVDKLKRRAKAKSQHEARIHHRQTTAIGNGDWRKTQSECFRCHVIVCCVTPYKTKTLASVGTSASKS